MFISIDTYSDFLDKYLGELYNDYWKFELNRTDSQVDQYKANKLLQVCTLVDTCNSFFRTKIQATEDYKSYIKFLENLGNEESKNNEMEMFVLAILTTKIFDI